MFNTGFLEGNSKRYLCYLMAATYVKGMGVPQNYQYALEYLEQCVECESNLDSVALVRFNEDGMLEKYTTSIEPIVNSAKQLIAYLRK